MPKATGLRLFCFMALLISRISLQDSNISAPSEDFYDDTNACSVRNLFYTIPLKC
jgi:hypothetical protein